MITQDTLPKLLYPVAGWLADVKFGRYRVIKASMTLMWIGSVILLAALIVQYSVTYLDGSHNTTNKILWFIPVLVLVYLVNAVGIAGFHSNVIPFGLDQMEDGSGEEYSAFIHWYYWTRNFSIGTLILTIPYSTNCNYYTGQGHSVLEHGDKIDLIILATEVGFLSLALCLDFLISDWLVKEPKTQNPLKKVVQISTFVAKHKHPVGWRSAFTYTSIASRTDLAKTMYGGSFESEDVEAVKTFWRILILMLSLGAPAILVETVSTKLLGPHKP